MPGFIHTPKDEAKWERAKEAAGKSAKKDSKSYWKLSNYIYHKMGKSETDSSNAQFIFDTMNEDEKKLAKDFYVSQSSFRKSEQLDNVTIENHNTFLAHDTGATQSIIGKEVIQMSEEKKYSAREAAIAVLQKAEEVIKKSQALKKAAESKHDRCVEHVKENSPEVKNPHAACVAQGVKPAAWGKSEQPAGEIKPKEHVEGEPVNPGDRVKEQVAPESNPKEQAEGNNPEWGTDPGKKGHFKLAKFIGHMEAKRKMSKGAY